MFSLDKEDWELYINPVNQALREVIESQGNLATEAEMMMKGFKAEYDALNKHYPTVHASTQPRDSADGSCIEKFVIK